MTANNDPLGVEFCLSVPEAELRGEAFLGPTSRQTGFLHQAAVVSLGTTTEGCPRVISGLSTLSTSDCGINRGAETKNERLRPWTRNRSLPF
jgi:hypothetical protein